MPLSVCRLLLPTLALGLALPALAPPAHAEQSHVEPAHAPPARAVPAAAPTAGHDTPLPAPEDGALCQGFGPQTPRDIALRAGTNSQIFPLAPAPAMMNLCNIHTHTNAEHRGPGFPVASLDPEAGGFKCEGSDQLSAAELEDPAFGHGPFHGVKPGDTIEVHWVYSSCDVQPGKGLGACLSDSCSNPTLRVESQVFLVVNDPFALDFGAYTFDGHISGGRPQPKALPRDTGTPVVFRGSTTGPNYSQAVCSPLQVTWSVRPRCARLDITSLYNWAARGNVFEEDHSHGVRKLVTAPSLLAPMIE
ncbi:hypothetical protein KM176_00900 [Pseudooceanicola sp. CBS1P-1]|uniref:Cadmium carbonic anhydrase n=1 Tax=Pseudooceanicola albus TaxID=2692189 RepID=A0A6L7G0J1_9RHOB|nr:MULTISPECIES: delta-class carbonic anhydrase [Pseudooceanicola]MBT9382405.1 hypothetical protein [Pseudooceanicola endophyticus]MXN16946.1 hypothetical protein [Pseudooceanicola albus]